MSEMATE